MEAVEQVVQHELKKYHEAIEFELYRAVRWYATQVGQDFVDYGWAQRVGRIATMQGESHSVFSMDGHKLLEMPTAETWIKGDHSFLRFYDWQ